MLNLVSAANASDKEILWGFINKYAPEANPNNNPALDKLADFAVRYYQDFILPNKIYRSPSARERAALIEFREYLESFVAHGKTESDIIQTTAFEVGKNHGFENLRDWFKAIYEICLGQSSGPKIGTFTVFYGTRNMIALIDDALAGKMG